MKRQLYSVLILFLKYKYFYYFELKWLLLICSFYNSTLSYQIKQFIFCKLNFIFYKSTIVRMKNCCLFSGRCFAINSRLNLSRFNVRRVINNGLVSGYRRNSW